MHKIVLKSKTSLPECAKYLDRSGIKAPGFSDHLRELKGIASYASNLSRWPFLKSENVGCGHKVMLIPGLLCSDRSMRMIKSFLEKKGFETCGWELGRNTGNIQKFLPLLYQRIIDESKQNKGPISLIGWSLGGYLGRELARELPHAISSITTLASPIWGGPRYTFAANWYRSQGYNLEEIEFGTLARYEQDIHQPITAFYSKQDGVVSWECCIDHWSQDVRHIERNIAHIAMGADIGTLELVLENLIRMNNLA